MFQLGSECICSIDKELAIYALLFNVKSLSFEAIHISDLPKVPINPSSYTHIQNLKFVDSNYHTPGPIDILAGADFLPYILKPGRILGKPGQPVTLTLPLAGPCKKKLFFYHLLSII